MKRIILLFAMVALAFVATGQTIERIQISSTAGGSDSFQPVIGGSFGVSVSGGSGSVTITSEYGEATYYGEIPEDVPTPLRIAEGISVYPNPTSYAVEIELDGNYSATSVDVYDLNGRLVMMREINGDGPLSLDVSKLSAGTYVIKAGKATAKMVKK